MADKSQNQPTTEASASRGVVPLELFLEIADRYVESAYAEAATEASTWHVEGCPDALDSIYITDNHAFDYASQRQRWRLISDLANLRSKRVSDIVDKTFCRSARPRKPGNIVFSIDIGTDLLPRQAYVLPEIDIFVLDFKAADRHNNADGESPEPLETAILALSSESAAGPLRMIRNVSCSLGNLMTATSKQIRALAALPELRRVQTWCAIQSPVQPDEPLHDHRAILPVDPAILPDLAAELALSDTRLLLLWGPLFDAGVEVTIQPRYAKRGEIELVRTDGGLRMRFVEEECKCYRIELA
ncbi:hypothetical protein BDP81DRAFT_447745 [Colletotrichum phormii]|uniref:Uncharacterized protein n=1 Tax=Colletotrichum phormii TaxID=359342 RepID=A0AAJ0EG13_9PEZI|nr:uncharacterized protein BDP81DRAFT_447745 [Colletotrichum phormii]KAK1638812.1 hypothetical protein BDP81DRAFT_447745 [Colletotrichum phormii]